MRRAGRIAVPVASALMGAVATASVAWAAAHPPVNASQTTASAATHSASAQRVVIRHDDLKVRTVVVPATSTQVSAPATHTTSGASGAAH